MAPEERMVNVPLAGGLIYFPPSDFADTKMTCVYFLSNGTPAPISCDRDRAVLRAYLTLALARLDAEEAGP
jgi:hypothetical protein